MRAFRFIPVAAALLASGCIDGLSPASERTGFISASTVSLGGGTSYGLTFIGAFYRFDGLEVGFEEPDACQGYVYTPGPIPVGTFPTVNAGDRLITLISGRQDTLVRSSVSGIESYTLSSSVGSVPMIPGDTLTVDIPGSLDGFPAVSVRVRTAEPYVFDPLVTPADGAPLAMTWTAAPAPGSLMLVYMRFSSLSTSDIPNTEIRCAFTDDGSGSLIPGFTSAWFNSPLASRSVVTQRARLTTAVVDSKTKVLLVSFFDRPLPAGVP